ncbi:MAG: TM2 domain-containing protein [Spirochaeta sp.]
MNGPPRDPEMEITMKSLRTAYLFWLPSLMGLSGLHRLYLGKPFSGLLFLITGGLFGLGTIYDAFAMPTLVQQARLREGIQGRVDINELFGDVQVTVEPGVTRPGDGLEQGILRVAKRGNGYAAPGEVALEAGVSLEQARKALDTLSEKGFCELMVRQTGSIVYYFPDFAPAGSDGSPEPLW